VKFRAVGAAALLRRNLLIYGPRRHHRALRRHQGRSISLINAIHLV